MARTKQHGRSIKIASPIKTDSETAGAAESATTMVTTTSETSGAAEVSTAAVTHRRHKFRPGTVAIREIRRYQKTTEPLLKRTPFTRLVREILQNHSMDYRLKPEAVLALREASEAFIVERFEDATLGMVNAKRVTLMVKDMDMVRNIK